MKQRQHMQRFRAQGCFPQANEIDAARICLNCPGLLQQRRHRQNLLYLRLGGVIAKRQDVVEPELVPKGDILGAQLRYLRIGNGDNRPIQGSQAGRRETNIFDRAALVG
jgi:hypothetical protein